MICTWCTNEIKRGEPYRRTKRGPHHADCRASLEARVCGNCRHYNVGLENDPCVLCSIPKRADHWESANAAPQTGAERA